MKTASKEKMTVTLNEKEPLLDTVMKATAPIWWPVPMLASAIYLISEVVTIF